MNKLLVAVHNGKKVTVKDGKTILFELEHEAIDGFLDQRLESHGYARVSSWKKVGKYSKTKVVEK